MILHSTTIGDAEGTAIVLVHGLFGQGRNLGAIARRIAKDRRVILVDQRNHGASPHDPDHSYPALAQDLAEVIEREGGQVDLAGHSMGGKTAMVLALTRPELVRKLVIMDIAPVAYAHSQLALIDAMEAIDLNGIDRQSVANKRLAEHVDEAGLRAFLLQSLDLKTSPAEWRLNLPALRAAMNDITGWPDGLPKGSFNNPTMFMVGADSDYVGAAGKDAIKAYFPSARLVQIKGAGHWLHADAPETVADALVAFMGKA